MSQKNKQDWEDLAELDSLWAILTTKEGKFNKWDVEKFFQTGEQVIQEDLEHAKKFNFPLKFDSALDFGCGVGRLTRALGSRFNECYGIDISEIMIEKAKQLNKSISNCKFYSAMDLSEFPDNKFDLVYTNIVLMHIPKKMIKTYIQDFMRIVKKDGLVIFQLPTHIPYILRIQPKRRVYTILKKIGFNKQFLYKKLRLFSFQMNFIPEEEVLTFLKKINAKIIHVKPDQRVDFNVKSSTYFITK